VAPFFTLLLCSLASEAPARALYVLHDVHVLPEHGRLPSRLAADILYIYTHSSKQQLLIALESKMLVASLLQVRLYVCCLFIPVGCRGLLTAVAGCFCILQKAFLSASSSRHASALTYIVLYINLNYINCFNEVYHCPPIQCVENWVAVYRSHTNKLSCKNVIICLFILRKLCAYAVVNVMFILYMTFIQNRAFIPVY
jgi:hypothetical protein